MSREPEELGPLIAEAMARVVATNRALPACNVGWATMYQTVDGRWWTLTLDGFTTEDSAREHFNKIGAD